jgi:two-component system, NarL family, nitrate/nitrite response regulator NarL
MADEIAVLIAGEVRVYREGLAQVLGQTANIRVVDTAGSAAELVSRAHAARPDVVLLDIAMPGIQEAVRGLLNVAIVAFAVPDSEAAVMECVRAGVSGFVARDASLQDILAAVESTARGQVTCPPRIVARLFYEIAGRRVEPAWPACSLTARERQVVALIDRGCSNKEIAHALHITVSTVKNHVHSILEKCQVRRRTDAALMLSAERPLAG